MGTKQISSSRGKTTAPPRAPGGSAAAVPRRRVAKARKAEPVIQNIRAITPEERTCMIAEAAYLRAERRGFASGNELDDWLEAEAEVEAALRRK